MRRSRRVALACVLLAAVVACAPIASQEPDGSEGTTSINPPIAQDQDFGESHQFATGLSVTVSEPRPLVPSDTAYPQAEHAIAFEVAVHNGTDRPYEMSSLAISAVIDGDAGRELRDSAQGINGTGGSDKTVAVSRTGLVITAFVSPADPGSVRIIVRPDPDDSESVEYRR